MTRLLVHLLVSALLLWLVSRIVHGIHIADFGYALLAALVLGVVNFLIRPILIVVTLPITIVTLGLFLFVINALMLMLTGAIVPGFKVDSFGAALIGGLLLALFNLVASALLNRRELARAPASPAGTASARRTAARSDPGRWRGSGR
jgi:putative membrane protein